MTFRDPTAAALDMCRSLEAKISAKEEKIYDLKQRLARVEDRVEYFHLLRPMGSVEVAAVLGMLLGILTAFLLR